MIARNSSAENHQSDGDAGSILWVGSFESHAEVAQLVEHDLAKVGVAGSSPVFRSDVDTGSEPDSAAALLASTAATYGSKYGKGFKGHDQLAIHVIRSDLAKDQLQTAALSRWGPV